MIIAVVVFTMIVVVIVVTIVAGVKAKWYFHASKVGFVMIIHRLEPFDRIRIQMETVGICHGWEPNFLRYDNHVSFLIRVGFHGGCNAAATTVVDVIIIIVG